MLSAAFVFASCGGGVDADIAKTKGYLCKGIELGKKAQEGAAAAIAELETLGKEMETYLEELKAKYPDGSDDAKKFETEMDKVVQDPDGACK